MKIKKPNIVLIITHDSGCHFGCYGVPTVNTPNIDNLASEGILLTNMYATSSICSPSRASLLSGQWPQNNGVVGLASYPYNWDFTNPKRHLSHICRNSGYKTMLFGMHHDMLDSSKMGDLVDPCPISEKEESRFAVRTAKAFAKFIKKESTSFQKPFYAQIGFFETHTPFSFGGVQPDNSKGVWIPPYVEENSGKYLFKKHSGQKVDPFDKISMQNYISAMQGSFKCADEAVGIILNALRENNLEENTIIIFTTDHGVELPRAKWTMYDAGIKIAFIIKWHAAGIKGGKKIDHLLSNVDFLPTLAELADLKINHKMDGKSFLNLLTGKSSKPIRDTVYSLFVNEELYCARTNRYKLIRFFQEGSEYDNNGNAVLRRFVQLYDLLNDPLEMHDLANNPAYADVRKDMDSRLFKWMKSVKDPILKGPIPTPFYKNAMHDFLKEKYIK